MQKITKRKLYKQLRQIHSNIPAEEIGKMFDVYELYKKLNFQLKLLKIAKIIEKPNIGVIEIPILRFISKLINFIRWKIYDLIMLVINGREFNQYGLSIYCGRQGGGKSISMVEYINRIKLNFPDCIIVTNFGYLKQDMPLTDWRQFTEIRNGVKGVIFAIDEIQNEYNSTKWQDFPEDLLREVTQQRKQRVKIVATSQVFTRVVKQLREQCFEVIECKTFLGRWTRQKCYDADDYNLLIESLDPKKKFKVPKKYRYSFIQSNKIRQDFDSYRKIEDIKNKEFILRNERGI